MMSSDFYFRDKIPVAILGATGCVGQKFIQLLSQHPWFQIVAVCASERSVGKRYRQAVNWLMPVPLPQDVGNLEVLPCEPSLNCSLVFSGLDASVAGEIETRFAQAGYPVVSNSRNHRLDPHVPLLVAEVNPDHLELVRTQSFEKGMIVTNPNCSAMGLVVALKPLIDQFGIEAVQVVTLQALSGAGYPGVASLDIIDNVIPYIKGEEEKLEKEPLKILGRLQQGRVEEASFVISAQCNRVPILDGHLECVSVKLKKSATQEEMIQAWRSFSAEPQQLNLPSAPFQPIHYFDEENYPQPRLHRHLDKGMAVSIGRLRSCPLLDYRFVLLSHNTVRGAAGAAILNAELMVCKGLIYW
jgi:aspartate-semialdehyde dehydrogenase